MAINLASKYSNKVDERFSVGSLTENIGLNKEYDWSGTKTITVYNIDTAPMNDYTRSGANRYGTANELGDTTTEYTVTKDRSFTFTIDRGNYNDQLMVKEAGKSLARQIKEVVTPEIDIYRFATWSATAIANGKVTTEAITKENAYLKFLDAQETLTDAKVPLTGRVCFVTTKFLNALKLDDSFTKAGDMSQKMLINGQVGEVDGVRIIGVPSSYLPTNHSFILLHPSCTVCPKKLQEYKTHDNPPGINGWLVEGRQIYDAFVLEAKKNAIFVHKNA
ncbi:hypothetical protein [Clostridium sp. BNL1100]|uniref:hypothetical protein n=1 Tax=Clostridium sp. BNL1100 TaxID=755731 RepID=UPI00024A7A95|nr:hypothetical protein [Clostridium sp. BNL1100]AEY66605.1 hypothetical protein Clo1100_2434 [Clostridium sp. BNL1100]